MTTLHKACTGLQAFKHFLRPKFETFVSVKLVHQGKYYDEKPVRPEPPISGKLNPPPRKRLSPWLIRPTRTQYNEDLTKENREFIQQVIKDKYPQADAYGSPSPLKLSTVESNVEWNPRYKRVGVIAKKIGIYPMWMKDGKKILTTMFQVIDNHVIKYIPPEEYKPVVTKRKTAWPGSIGCLVVGAIGCDPQMFTKEYCGLFEEAGVMPKRLLARFQVSAAAALQPGTPLYASHFQVGQHVDIRGKTIDRGFQGVMKRWGFHGQPATHGQTKTHRRPGNIGSGGNKARVMPGTKLPGHMGNRYRILRGMRIIRINRKYNVIWTLGQGSPGETNSLCQIYDTLLPLRNFKALNITPAFPTYFPSPEDETLPEEIIADDIHNFNDPTITYQEE